MRSARAIAFLIAITVPMAAAKDRHCQLRLHVEANLHDTVAFASAVKANVSGRDVVMERTARISESDITGFCPYHAANGSHGVLIQLDEHGRMMLEALSIERRGGLLFAFVNGRPITELQIDKRVSDGKIYIPSGLIEADIKLMEKDWRLLRARKHK
jgi:hypothetical protein